MAKMTERDKEAIRADAIEVNKLGEKVYTQQKLADKYGISKGMVNRYVKNTNAKSKQIIDEEVRLLVNLHEIQEVKSNSLSKQEQIEVNKQVELKTKDLGLVQEASRYFLKKSMSYVKNKPGHTMYDLSIGSKIATETGMNLGVIPRFAPKTEINNTNAAQTVIEAKEPSF